MVIKNKLLVMPSPKDEGAALLVLQLLHDLRGQLAADPLDVLLQVSNPSLREQAFLAEMQKRLRLRRLASLRVCVRVRVLKRVAQESRP